MTFHLCFYMFIIVTCFWCNKNHLCILTLFAKTLQLIWITSFLKRKCMKLIIKSTFWILCFHCLKIWIHLVTWRIFNFSMNRDNALQLLKCWFKSCICCCLMKQLQRWIFRVNALCRKRWTKQHWVEQRSSLHIDSALFDMQMSFSSWRMTRLQKLTRMRNCSDVRAGTTLCAWRSLWIRHDVRIIVWTSGFT